MKFLAIIFVLSALLPLLANAGHLDLSGMDPSTRAQVINSIVLPEVEFKNASLTESLQEVSRLCVNVVGSGFSIIQRGHPTKESEDITLKAKDITVSELCKYLGAAADAQVSVTTSGCVIEFPSEPLKTGS